MKGESQLDIEQVYKAPVASGATAELEASTAAPFYVVSGNKLLLLYIGTLGVYQVYWFYKHWKQYRPHLGRDVSPIGRGIFSIFFVHELFRAIHAWSDKHGRPSHWKPSSMAGLYVGLTIASVVVDRVSNAVGSTGLMNTVALAVGLAACVPLYTAQAAANVACGDPEGKSNSAVTVQNYLFLMLGGLFWLLTVAGLYYTA